MADLLNSLVVPSSPRSSQDSFRSLSSQPRTQSASPPPSKSQAISTGPLPFQDPAFQAASLPVYDIDSYLAQNAGLRSTPSNTKKASKRPAPANTGSPEPVSLGTKTGGFAVATLNTQCQIKGFLPAFEIDGVSDFGGALKLRDVTVTSDQRWSSKKEAKEGLAEKGLERLKSMEATSKEPGVPQEVGKNWVGMLHQYHNLTTPNLGPVYHDYALGLAFASTCTIPSLPDQPFGSKTDAFPSKKAAHINAAKEAVEHLIEKGELNDDGTTKARKKLKLGTPVRIQGRGLEVKKDSTYAQKVNAICPLLGLTCPQYQLGPVSSLAPNMLSGYATFPNEPGLPAQIGEVRNVFGKKKAREEVAMGVWEALKALAAERSVSINEEDENDASGYGAMSENGSARS